MNSADTNAILLAIGYQADLDVNMDGAVDSKDSSEVSKLSGRTLTAGQLSDRGNIVGWCGYLYEESTGMWLARHRWQIPELGRWANRDPIGYAGGSQNLYEYVNGNPVFLQDPSGLQPRIRIPTTKTMGFPSDYDYFVDAMERAGRTYNAKLSECYANDDILKLLHEKEKFLSFMLTNDGGGQIFELELVLETASGIMVEQGVNAAEAMGLAMLGRV